MNTLHHLLLVLRWFTQLKHFLQVLPLCWCGFPCSSSCWLVFLLLYYILDCLFITLPSWSESTPSHASPLLRSSQFLIQEVKEDNAFYYPHVKLFPFGYKSPLYILSLDVNNTYFSYLWGKKVKAPSVCFQVTISTGKLESAYSDFSSMTCLFKMNSENPRFLCSVPNNLDLPNNLPNVLVINFQPLKSHCLLVCPRLLMSIDGIEVHKSWEYTRQDFFHYINGSFDT